MINSQLKDENTLLKAQLAASVSPQTVNPESVEVPTIIPSQTSNLEMDKFAKEYEEKLSLLQQKIIDLETKLSVSLAANSEMTTELERLRTDQDELLELLADQVTLFFFLF